MGTGRGRKGNPMSEKSSKQETSLSIHEPTPDAQVQKELLGQKIPKRITTQEQLEGVRQYVGRVSQFREKIETDFGEPIKELETPLKRLKNSLKSWLDPLKAREKECKGLISDYLLAEQKKLDEANQKALDKHDAKTEKALEQGKEPPPPPAMKTGGPKKIQTVMGTQSVRTLTYVRLKGMAGLNTQTQEPVYKNQVGQLDVPDSLWKLDWTRVSASQKAGTLPVAFETYETKSLIQRKS